MGFFTRFTRFFKNNVPADSGTVGLNDAEFLRWLGIDPERPEAISETTYFTCMKVLSETMGKLPLKLFRKDDKGGMVRADIPGADVILNRPNPFMTPATFWSTMELNCNHYGNAYAWIQKKYVKTKKYGGYYEVVALWPMKSDHVTVYMDNVGWFGGKGEIYYHYTDPKSSEFYVFRADDVLHIKTWMTWDGIMGKSVMDILSSTITGASYSQKYLDKLYETGLTASSVLQYTGDLDEKLRRKLQDKYNELLSGAKNAGKVVALPVGMTLSPLSYKLTDAQFMELKKHSALQIAAAFGVKPNQINDYTKSSYANSETQQLAFLVDTMLYRLSVYEQELKYKLLTKKQREDQLELKFNEKVLLRTDAEAQMKTLTSGVNNGIYTPNEARHNLNLPAQEGGDVLIVNGNYVPLTNVGAAYRKNEEGGKGE